MSDAYEDDVCRELGFTSPAEYLGWEREGCPLGRCSNPLCGMPAFWPNLHTRCRHCGSPVNTERMIPPLGLI